LLFTYCLLEVIAMPALTPEILSEVVAACNAGAGEAASGLGRTLDAQLSMAVGESEAIKAGAIPPELNGPGLAILFVVETSGAVLVLPESSSFVPAWCAAPDATGQSKLATLAQELGMNLLPEAFMPDDFKAARVDNLSAALVRSEISGEAQSVLLNLSTPDGKQGVARLIWPLAKPAEMFNAPAEAKPEVKPEPKPVAVQQFSLPTDEPPQPQPAQVQTFPARTLPNYSRSLLKIMVPVIVTLAEKKQPLSQIVEMGPGMIIQFEKSCEEMLELEIGERKVAAGEAIKVGDKFGLRITSIIMPEERFNTVKSPKQARR
jgi:flagellar motor switch/type III secretory pathway protein FliN